jgi:hypothetical protein
MRAYMEIGGITPLIFNFGSSQLHAPTALSPGKESPAPTEEEAVWTTELVLAFWRRRNFLPLPGIKLQITHTTLFQILVPS